MTTSCAGRRESILRPPKYNFPPTISQRTFFTTKTVRLFFRPCASPRWMLFGYFLHFLGKKRSEVLPTEAVPGTEEGTIFVASPGTYGDSAMGRNRTVLSLTGKSREHLAAGRL